MAGPDGKDALDALSAEEREALAFLDSDEYKATMDEPLEQQQAQPEQQSAPAPAPAAQPAPIVQQDLPAPAPAPQAAPQQTQQTQPAPAQQEAQAPIPAPVAMTFPQFKAPDNADALAKQYDDREDAIGRAFDEGELTQAEFRTQLAEINRQRTDLNQTMMLAKISQEATQQTYDTAVQSFLAANQQYQPGSREWAYLDAELKMLQEAAIKQGADYRNPAFLSAAHQNVSALLKGITATQAQQQDQQQTNKPGLPPPSGYNIPPAFHQIPNAAPNELADPLKEQLQKLDALNFEDAFGRLSEADQERFLRAQ